MSSPDHTKVLKAVELTINLLNEIENIDISTDVAEQIKSIVVAEVCGMAPSLAPAKTSTIIECLKKHGGCASRAEIAAATNMNPNSISSLLNKLVKRGIVLKLLLPEKSTNDGRGHKPEYIFCLVDAAHK
ncbi:hypothetical protein NIES4071_108230 (plasmid) [Calothrix sp. NIES-4071]|nr:hypothetical protein NIES4071_108230 [Calothrix sp. NIES-4071]BAZ64863.1 hypothetical protein NIES4105_105960 [Calothrix sp. NIES-4105]